MSRQAHILSFDDVRRENTRYSSTPVRAHRASDDPAQTERAPRRQNSPLLSYLSDDSFAYDPYEDSAYGRERNGSRRRSRQQQAPERTRRASDGRRAAASSRAERNTARAKRAESTRVEADQANEEFEQRTITAADRRRAKAKSKAKAKAERAYAKQFGSDVPSGEDGPRAAVYKGQMGASQRRAQRMQEGEGAPSANRRKAGFSLASLSGIAQTRGFMVGAVVAACLVLSFMFLYGPAQQNYCSVRDHDKLAIEYAALSDRNNALQTDVDSLQTDAGIEQRAHDQLGWVKQGEESAKVRGLDLDNQDQGTGIIANISSDSIQAPTTWYSPVLDVVFGYK